MKIIIISILMLSLSSCARMNDHAELSPENPIEYYNNNSFSPPDPLKSYGFKESSWTNWNKFWFTSAIGGQAADTLSTFTKLNEGCIEKNPLFGEDPNKGVMILSKAAVLGTMYWYTEYYLDKIEDQQNARNWLYGISSILGFGAAGWNMSQECN